MMAYIDALIGALVVWGWFWIVTSSPWHRWMHQGHDGVFLRGRLVCRHCVQEIEDTTKDEWRQEIIAKVRRLL